MKTERSARRVVRITEAENQSDRVAPAMPESNGGGAPVAARGLPDETGPTSDGAILCELDRMLYDLSMCPRCRI